MTHRARRPRQRAMPYDSNSTHNRHIHRKGSAAQQAEARFAAAVEKVVAKSGSHARHILLSSRRRITVRQIETLSRMARQRQRYELNELANGRPLFRKPKHGTPPLDTERYSEVPSRIGRAWGHVNKVARGLKQLGGTSPVTIDNVAPAITKVEEIQRVSRTLQNIVRRIPAEGRSPKSKVYRTSTMPFNLSRMVGALAAAKGLVEKNVRDLPRLPRSIKPTAEQKAYILRRLREIVALCHEVTLLLSH